MSIKSLQVRAKETYGQKIERINREVAELDKKREQRDIEAKMTKALREARAQEFIAHARLAKERLTPSPVIAETARTAGRASIAAGRAGLAVGIGIGRGIKDIGKRYIVAAREAQARIPRYTLAPMRSPDTTYEALEATFGYSPFTLQQAVSVLIIGLNADVPKANRLVNNMMHTGTIRAITK